MITEVTSRRFRRSRGLWTEAGGMEAARFFARLRQAGAAVSMDPAAALAAGH